MCNQRRALIPFKDACQTPAPSKASIQGRTIVVLVQGHEHEHKG